MNLDQAIQLHESLEIHYYVDHYAAELYVSDGYRIALTGKGEDIDSAINDLRKQLENIKNIDTLRKLKNES